MAYLMLHQNFPQTYSVEILLRMSCGTMERTQQPVKQHKCITRSMSEHDLSNDIV